MKIIRKVEQAHDVYTLKGTRQMLKLDRKLPRVTISFPQSVLIDTKPTKQGGKGGNS